MAFGSRKGKHKQTLHSNRRVYTNLPYLINTYHYRVHVCLHAECCARVGITVLLRNALYMRGSVEGVQNTTLGTMTGARATSWPVPVIFVSVPNAVQNFGSALTRIPTPQNASIAVLARIEPRHPMEYLAAEGASMRPS